MERDHRLERELLDHAVVPEGFAEQVLARLAHVEETKGNVGWGRPADELLAEMGEEAADIAGWAMGAAHQLDSAQLERLSAAIELGAKAWVVIEELREQLACATLVARKKPGSV